MEFLKGKAGTILSMAFMIILGIYMLFAPGETLSTLVIIIGIVLIVIGAVRIVTYLLTKNKMLGESIQLAGALVSALAGIFVVCAPGVIISIFPIAMGITIAFVGIMNVFRALETKNFGNPRWGIMLALSLITVILGIVVFANPFGTMDLIVRIAGVTLIYNGVCGIIIAISGKQN